MTRIMAQGCAVKASCWPPSTLVSCGWGVDDPGVHMHMHMHRGPRCTHTVLLARAGHNPSMFCTFFDEIVKASAIVCNICAGMGMPLTGVQALAQAVTGSAKAAKMVYQLTYGILKLRVLDGLHNPTHAPANDYTP